MEKFTIEQIRKYIISQDSLGDVLYNLNEINILKANTKTVEEEDILDGHYYPGHECWEETVDDDSLKDIENMINWSLDNDDIKESIK